MTTIALQDPSSQPENLPAKSTPITLQDPSSKPGNRPTEVKTLSEARILPAWAQPIMSETESNSWTRLPDNLISTWIHIPYVLWGTLFLRSIHELTNNGSIHDITTEDGSGVNSRIHEKYCSKWHLEESVADFERQFLKDNTAIEPPVKTELNGEYALICRRPHQYARGEHVYLAYYGDKETIAHLLESYESAIKIQKAWAWAKEVVSGLPKAPKGLFARLFWKKD